ncbi:hypothetical protein H1C71_028551 [Ictidomys tridecemlineatus]|nr:hypothetical protein H1C71_028551 [Ictidomys tridecemlineatus]
MSIQHVSTQDTSAGPALLAEGGGRLRSSGTRALRSLRLVASLPAFLHQGAEQRACRQAWEGQGTVAGSHCSHGPTVLFPITRREAVPTEKRRGGGAVVSRISPGDRQAWGGLPRSAAGEGREGCWSSLVSEQILFPTWPPSHSRTQ